MASKRNSRIFMDEESRRPEVTAKPVTSNTNTPLRSRRSSRGSAKEDVAQLVKEMEERNAVSIREASNMARSQSTCSTISDKSTGRPYESTRE